jgi:hypothetical protein
LIEIINEPICWILKLNRSEFQKGYVLEKAERNAQRRRQDP